MIFGYILLFLFQLEWRLFQIDFNKFVDNFRYDLDQNNCLRAQIISTSLKELQNWKSMFCNNGRQLYCF